MPRSSFPCAKQSLVPHKAACLTCGCHGALKYQPCGLTSRIVPGWPVQEQTDCPAVSSFPRKALIREPERPSALEEELPESDGTKTGNTTRHEFLAESFVLQERPSQNLASAQGFTRFLPHHASLSTATATGGSRSQARRGALTPLHSGPACARRVQPVPATLDFSGSVLSL